MMPRHALVVLAALVGCQRAPAPVAPAIGNTPAPAADDPRRERTGDELLAMIPASREWVVYLDARRLRRSALWKGYQAAARERLAALVPPVVGQCGLDPLDTVDELYGGFSGESGDDATLIVRGPGREPVAACVRAHPELGVALEGDLVRDRAGPDAGAALFVDGRTLLADREAGRWRDGRDLATLTTSRPGQGVAGRLRELLAPIDRDATLWFAFAGDARMLQTLQVPLRGVRGEVRVGDTLSARIEVLFVDEQQPASIATAIRSQLDQLTAGPFAELAARTRVEAEGATLAIELQYERAQLDLLVGVIGGMP